MNKRNKKIIGYASLAIVLLIVIVGALLYKKVFAPFVDSQQTVYVYIDDSKNYSDLLVQLQEKANIKDVELFKTMSKAAKYPEKMKTGRYAVHNNMSCMELLKMLMNGIQSPCKITFNNMRLKEDLVERVGSQMMFEAGALFQQLDSPELCSQYGFDKNTIACMFMPDTYEIYWNTTVDNFLQRMKKEYYNFWTDDRMALAKEIRLSPIEVSILASIVEEETAARSEYPIVAGLYINRLHKGMLLQADPTVKYAHGDFALKRILFAHLEIDSPYNTYKNLGLPPGPIRIPSKRGIDAVLNYTKHQYIYMCAKEDFSGKHNFAQNMSEHSRNAAKYRAALNKNNIK
ncbi:aminodeoxychorismate lyase [Bacteroidales bacterium]|nr:aminodeoxychorismate lyase [Bacteroidales bacterium]